MDYQAYETSTSTPADTPTSEPFASETSAIVTESYARILALAEERFQPLAHLG